MQIASVFDVHFDHDAIMRRGVELRNGHHTDVILNEVKDLTQDD
jgi:hypothetical protein